MANRRDDFLSNADDSVVECRAFSHNWEDAGDFMNGRSVHIVLYCGRCDSYAVVEWSKSAGTIEGRKYKYSSGYLNNTGQPVTKADARVERIRRTKFQGTKEFEKLLDQIDEERESYR
jgi:hypothetical protein